MIRTRLGLAHCSSGCPSDDEDAIVGARNLREQGVHEGGLPRGRGAASRDVLLAQHRGFEDLCILLVDDPRLDVLVEGEHAGGGLRIVKTGAL